MKGLKKVRNLERGLILAWQEVTSIKASLSSMPLYFLSLFRDFGGDCILA